MWFGIFLLLCFLLVCAFISITEESICLIYLFDFIWVENWQELVQIIKSKGMKPGAALKPGTPVEEVYPLV